MIIEKYKEGLFSKRIRFKHRYFGYFIFVDLCTYVYNVYNVNLFISPYNRTMYFTIGKIVILN